MNRGPVVGIATLAAALGCSERQARRVAPDLGGYRSSPRGPWLVPADALAGVLPPEPTDPLDPELCPTCGHRVAALGPTSCPTSDTTRSTPDH